MYPLSNLKGFETRRHSRMLHCWVWTAYMVEVLAFGTDEFTRILVALARLDNHGQKNYLLSGLLQKSSYNSTPLVPYSGQLKMAENAPKDL